MSAANVKLPGSVVTKYQFVKFLAEFEAIDRNLTTREIRAAAGAKTRTPTEHSPRIDQFLEENNIRLTDGEARSAMLSSLRSLRKSAPIVHVTFAAEADFSSVAKVAGWFRQNIDPCTLLEVGLQPSLIAGVYVRSQNKIFDYSLKSRVKGQREALMNALRTPK